MIPATGMTGNVETGARPAVRRLAGWFLLGVLVAGFALWSQLRAVEGELAFVLRVGHESSTRPLIEEELGPIPLTEGLGHDGQYSYLIARDPLGLDGLPDLADDGAYRYRRALYGWLAGGFGLFPPQAALFGLAAWTIIGFGAATAATADVASLLGARWWAVLGVLGNLGLWLSVQLATADALAMALAMLAVSLALRKRTGWAVLALAASARRRMPTSCLRWGWPAGCFSRANGALPSPQPWFRSFLWRFGSDGCTGKSAMACPLRTTSRGPWSDWWSRSPNGRAPAIWCKRWWHWWRWSAR